MEVTMNPFIAVLLMALVTYLPRVAPMVIFRKKLNSKFLQSFLHYVPYSVLAALTIPDVFTCTNDYVSAICGTVVAVILAFFERSLVVVAIGAIVTVYGVGLFF